MAMGNLKKRLMTSAVLITLCLLAIFYIPNWMFSVIVVVFVLLGLDEFLSMVEGKGYTIHRIASLVFGGMIPVFIIAGFELSILYMACICFFLILFSRRSTENSIASVGLAIFGMVYVCAFLSYLIPIKGLPQGSWLVFYIILVVKGGDAGAYFVGKTFGKIKLIEKISPKKTVEGSGGQVITTVLLSLISKVFLPDIALFHLLILGVILGVLAQLGDLVESLLKRDAGVKDSGNIPGLGGILDVLDSLLFAIPFVYFYLTHFVGGYV